MAKIYKIKSPIQRFLLKIKINIDYWEWQDSLDKDGYGHLRVGDKKIRVHRWIYEYYYGSICPVLTIDHLCRNRGCCNPFHLEQVTQKENTQRGLTGKINNHNKIKTHCKRGHEFTHDNVYIGKKGNRICKKCHKILDAKKYLQIKELRN